MTTVIDPEPSSPGGSILDYIHQNPGTDQEDIAQALCMKIGHTRHYLEKLRKEGTIHIIRQGSLKRYYPVEPLPVSEPPPEPAPIDDTVPQASLPDKAKWLTEDGKDLYSRAETLAPIIPGGATCDHVVSGDVPPLEVQSSTAPPANREWLLSELTRLSDEASDRGLRVKATVEWTPLRADVVITEVRG